MGGGRIDFPPPIEALPLIFPLSPRLNLSDMPQKTM
jgi:hypothetical protein